MVCRVVDTHYHTIFVARFQNDLRCAAGYLQTTVNEPNGVRAQDICGGAAGRGHAGVSEVHS